MIVRAKPVKFNVSLYVSMRFLCVLAHTHWKLSPFTFPPGFLHLMNLLSDFLKVANFD